MARPRIKRIKPIERNKKIILDDNYSLRKRRSSMRVNLSFISNLSDSENSSLNRKSIKAAIKNSSMQTADSIQTVKKKKQLRKLKVNEDVLATPVNISNTNVTVIHVANRNTLDNNINKESDEVQRNSLNVIEEKELQLNQSCMKLKNAIMSKTRALFDKENELAIKTSEILTGHSPGIAEPEVHELNDQRTPSVRMSINKNEQILMSGDGIKKNPVKISAMQRQSPEKEAMSRSDDDDDDDDVYMDCNQSIVSTPKKIIRIDDNKNMSNNKSNSKIVDTSVRIPVARLFVSNRDPNKTVSDLNLVQSLGSQKTNESIEIEKSKNKEPKSLLNTFLNNPDSPILSQGKRRSRFSLSLKKKLGTKASTTTDESFLNRQPLVSSSFIEKSTQENKQNDADKNFNTINLDDSESLGKTLNIDDSTNKSSMEITTISSHMPIIRRSFQNEIRKSLKLDNVSVSLNNTERFKIPTQVRLESNKILSKDIQGTEKAQNIDECQEDCSVNTIRTSLNVNTSLDKISSVDDIAQKENQTPNSSDITSTSISSKNQVNEDGETLVQRQSTFIIPTAKPKKSSINSKKSSTTKNKHEMKKKNDKIPGSQSTDSSLEKESNEKVPSQQTSSSSNQEKESIDQIIPSRQPSASTIRSSMVVNTSLDYVRKSLIPTNVLDFNKMVTMIQDTSSKDNQSKESIYSTNDISSDSDNDLESVSLIERLRNISDSKKNNELKRPNTKRSCTRSNSSKNQYSRMDENANASEKRKSTEVETVSLHKTRKSCEVKKSIASTLRKSEIRNMSNEASIIETTPYPASRSVLLKAIIKNNIAMNTIDPRKFVDLSDDDNGDNNFKLQTIIHKKKPTVFTHKRSKSIYARKKSPSSEILDTILVNSSDESSTESEQEKEQVVIEESINLTKTNDKSKNNQSVKDKLTNDEEKLQNEKDKLKSNKPINQELKDKKLANKRKLYALRDNSLISFSPADIGEKLEKSDPDVKKRKTKKRKASLIKKPEIVDDKPPFLTPELGLENESEINYILPERIERKKKPRKRFRKKIVIKKTTNLQLLDEILQNEEKTQRISQRDSLREFDLRRMKQNQSTHKNTRIVIVVTGLSKGDKDLVKSVIKALGSAVLELNVTPRTTHVISTGVRTINLLKGILRGCWLLSLEWALKSLENGKWLDPSPYEMSHFAKAVQENRRDRQLFGKAYVPELFVTCGLIYIENGTSPPASVLKELVKIAGGRITEDLNLADIQIGTDGLKEIWILDAITTGEVQPIEQYKRN